MIVDALILAGGRSSRLGGTAKAHLSLNGESLLDCTVRLVRNSTVRNVIVVGDDAPEGEIAVREDPAFGGPVAAIAAGVAALAGDADAVLVLACDMPGIDAALPALLDSAAVGAIALDRGRLQQLAIVVRTGPLRAALDALPTPIDASTRALLAGLDLTPVPVPDGATDDVDTWDDVARFRLQPLTSGSIS